MKGMRWADHRTAGEVLKINAVEAQAKDCNTIYEAHAANFKRLQY